MKIDELRERVTMINENMGKIWITTKEYLRLYRNTSFTQWQTWERPSNPDAALQIGRLLIYVDPDAEMERALSELSACLPDD